MPLSIRQSPMPLGASFDLIDSAERLAVKSTQGAENALLMGWAGRARGAEEGLSLWDPWE